MLSLSLRLLPQFISNVRLAISGHHNLHPEGLEGFNRETVGWAEVFGNAACFPFCVEQLRFVKC